MDTESYEGEVTFTLPITVAPGAQPGKHVLSVVVAYQSCNEAGQNKLMKFLFLTLFFLLLVQNGSAQRPRSAACHTHDILEVKFSPDATKLISYSAGDDFCVRRSDVGIRGESESFSS